MRIRHIVFFLIALGYSSQSFALLNGQSVQFKDYPSTVYFNFANWEGCTSAKIAPKTFLIAAHCFMTRQPQELTRAIKLVQKDLSNYQEFNTKIDHVYLPPNFQANFQIYGGLTDILIFTTTDDWSQVPSAQISFNPVQPNEIISIGGYGAQYMGGSIFPQDLCTGDKSGTPVHICPLSMVEKKISEVSDFVFSSDVTHDSFASLYHGDSGGPAYRYEDNHWSIIGINTQAPIGNGKVLDVVIRLSWRPTVNVMLKTENYKKWIEQVLSGNGSPTELKLN